MPKKSIENHEAPEARKTDKDELRLYYRDMLPDPPLEERAEPA